MAAFFVSTLQPIIFNPQILFQSKMSRCNKEPTFLTLPYLKFRLTIFHKICIFQSTIHGGEDENIYLDEDGADCSFNLVSKGNVREI
jgi:hypothetical protein